MQANSNYKETLERLLTKLADLNLTNSLRKERVQTGSGGFGDVYQGTLTNGEKVAIKCLRYFAFKVDRERFIMKATRELRVWSKVRNTSILPLKGYAIEIVGDLSLPTFVTDWMEKGSLYDFLRTEPEVNTLFLFKGIANGLHYLHQEGIIHGDLKSNNVLISANGVPLLADFGLSHLIFTTSTNEPATDAGRGDVRWQAPELVIPTEEFDTPEEFHTKESDVWALGMTGLEVLTGQLPYSNQKSDYQVLMALTRGIQPPEPDFKEWTEVDKDLWKMCKSCWAVDPTHRPTMAQLHFLVSYRSLNNRLCE